MRIFFLLIFLFIDLQVKNAESSFGLLLYSLGRLYHASEKHAKATGEWLA